MRAIIQYEHHGVTVSVREDLQGRHWEHCLCATCSLFKPEVREDNCKRASRLYDLCVELDMVAPVWECPTYERR